MAVFRLTVLTFALLAGVAHGAELRGMLPIDNGDVRSSFKAMMADDDDEDIDAENAGSLLQSSADSGMDSYMEDSANALSQSLGPRWERNTVEKNAKESTKALLDGIRGHNKAGMISGMLGAIPQ